MLNLSKHRSRLLTAKSSPKPKKSRKKLNNRRKFKSYADPTKHFHRRYTDYQVRCMGEVSRQARLANASEAEKAFADILSSIGIEFEREKYLQNGDRFVLIDAFVPHKNIAFEIDGQSHALQPKYDEGRTKWLLEVHRIKVVRFINKDVLTKPEAVKAKVMEIMNG